MVNEYVRLHRIGAGSYGKVVCHSVTEMRFIICFMCAWLTHLCMGLVIIILVLQMQLTLIYNEIQSFSFINSITFWSCLVVE